MDPLQWAIDPWGKVRPHPHRVVFDLGGGHRRLALRNRPRNLRPLFRQAQAVRPV